MRMVSSIFRRRWRGRWCCWRRWMSSRGAVSTSFRAMPPLLAFANDIFTDIEKDPSRRDAFRFDRLDRFPVDADEDASESPIDNNAALGIIAGPTAAACADTVAAEIR